MDYARGVRVTFYGVRGSIAVPGPLTARYGGNTVCVEARLADGTVVILDSGTGIRELGKDLMREGHTAPLHLLLTHLHWDHVLGLPFFRPLYRQGMHMTVHPMSTPEQRRVVKERILFDGIHFPIRAADLPATMEFEDTAEASYRIGSATIRRIALNHPGEAQGFRIDDDDGASLAYLTDNELSPPGAPRTTIDELARFAAGADLLVHDAQYIEADMPAKRGWGHSTVDDVLLLGQKAETPHLVFFHHDPERDDDALDALSESAKAWILSQSRAHKIAYEGLSVTLGPGDKHERPLPP
jgi:phosphoribosyl 1,2-cyclic phosphodiesterase